MAKRISYSLPEVIYARRAGNVLAGEPTLVKN
jgi:hypothetical protein